MAINIFYGRQRRFVSRRLTYLVLVLIVFAYSTLTLLSPNAAQTDVAEDAAKADASSKIKTSVDGIRHSLKKGVTELNPFRGPAHPPPTRAQDSYQGTSWWADWKWLSVPFSSSLTLDEDRALLPPLQDRPFIYCYYDATVKKSREEKDADSDLLLTWRRAWWAQGFRPTILGSSEATGNPMYQELQRLEVQPELKSDLMRWLAWQSMGTGMLVDYTLLPIAHTEDPLLVFLRRGKYPVMTRWKGLESALFVGPKEEVTKTIRKVMDSPTLKSAKSVIDASTKNDFKVDKAQTALVHYSPEIIKKQYPKVHDSITNGRARGLGALNRLINAHLHAVWQSSFPEGIEVLKPFPEHTTEMVTPALKLADSLAFCPDNPIPSSCPPGISSCAHCAAGTTSMKVTTPEQYQNTSGAFAIGTVPHPWTLATLTSLKERVDVSWIRKEAPRDPWLETITKGLLGSKVSSNSRIMHFKQAVADEHAPTHALWLSAEADIPPDLEWYFGFRIPKGLGETYMAMSGKIEQGPMPGKVKADKPAKAERAAKADGDTRPEKPQPRPEDTPKGKELTPKEMQAKEKALLEHAKKIVAFKKSTVDTRLRASLEAWNLADTEAWKFARAFLARRSMERIEWEKQESKYSGGAGSEKGRNAWSRWKDSKERE
ncbi:hypothetical protein RAB80_011975 [Fusarium oxysporum f. sp. vasinfectum]|uniref:Uncharacterized protein n=1 Tax=Fusarium oxysporum f. sp. vasinfectum 25433 TaxID=1089449 RepID=X0LKZ6_FUSOX|nr:hypothetical protein FOTG_06915 [Fusarium oxysporum f. sp. vasinfectum 25433]KAK2671896.1 hypothetical protein RAB80_011975 [Fusarium oxysporum f. sp. vasinfectum]KAK2928841.1 hypothetical protein FoTM2_011705 [Fusarium oxysporum f. sp. vasinfectum]